MVNPKVFNKQVVKLTYLINRLLEYNLENVIQTDEHTLLNFLKKMKCIKSPTITDVTTLLEFIENIAILLWSEPLKCLYSQHDYVDESFIQSENHIKQFKSLSEFLSIAQTLQKELFAEIGRINNSDEFDNNDSEIIITNYESIKL